MELIKITEKNNKQVVSARDLHKFLESAERFSKWFDRFADYGFEKDVDYTPYQNVHPQNGQEITDYAISIDMAKELSMLQRSEKGKQARKYFIECEKKLVEVQQKQFKLPDFNNPIEAARAWADAKEAEQIALSQASEALEQIEAAKPKIELYDMAMSSEDAIDMKTVATTLSLGIGRNSLFKLLREKQVLDAYNRPYQSMVNRGYFKTIETPYVRPNGDVHISIKTVVLQKGVEYIKKLIAKYKSNK